MIYYAFVAIKFNSQIQQAADGSKKISGALTFASILLILFSALFIIYSNGFFITGTQKRSRAILSLLREKKTTAKMLAYENLFMGLIALVAGIGIGALLSSGFTKLIAGAYGFRNGRPFRDSAAAKFSTRPRFLCHHLIYIFSRIQADLPFQTD
ncbi:hypothetical protein P7H17_03120 [Paenibacillus larvae]|nr:hypothetical protein [Paenibacillus larvae]